MAARANKASVEAAINGPDYEAALAIINGRVADAKARQSSASGDASQAWGSIEKLGVNKKGAQMFARVAGIEDEADRADQLRTFMKLCKLEGITIEGDLMDMAEAAAAKVEPAKKEEPAKAAATADEAKGKAAPASDQLDEKPAAKSGLRVVAGMEASKSHLGTDKPATKPGKVVPDALN